MPSLQEIFPHASKSFLALNAAIPRPSAPIAPGGEAQGAKLERRVRHGPLAKGKAQGGNPARVSVVITSYRVRLLDEDNLCEKYHCDCVRNAGLIYDDAPGAAKIEARQEKVATKAEERTEILISAIPPS